MSLLQVNSHSTHRNAMNLILLLPTFYKRGNQGIKKLNNLPKVIRVVNDRAKIHSYNSRDPTLQHYTMYQVKFYM